MTAERILLILMVITGAAFILGGQDLAFRADIAFGPGFLPILTGAGLAVCALIQLLRTTKHRMKDDEAEAQSSGISLPDLRGLMIAVAVMIAGVFAMVFGSVLVPVLLITALLSWLVSGHSLLRASIVATATLAVIYLIFAIWLGLPIR